MKIIHEEFGTPNFKFEENRPGGLGPAVVKKMKMYQNFKNCDKGCRLS